MKIRWEESAHKFGYLKLHLQDGTNRDATTEDLLLACKASELVVVSAKHVKDMQKLKRECSESASTVDSLCKALDRCSAYEKQVQELRAVLGDREGETLIDTARRVVSERETAKAGLRECALAVGLVAQPVALLRENGPMDQVLGAIRNAAREAKERAAAVKAAEEAERLRISERATIAQVDAVIVNRLQSQLEAAIARAEKAEAEVDDFAGLVRELNPRAEKAESDSAALADLYNKSRDRADALAAELAAIRAATGEEPTDEVARMREEVATLRAERDRLESIESECDNARVDLGAEGEGIEGAARRVMGEVLTLRARVAELEAAPVVMGVDHAAGPDKSVEATLAPDGTVISVRDIPAPKGQASPWLNQLSSESVEFWDAVNAFAVASGGRADAVNTARMNAVVRINASVKALLVGTPSDATARAEGYAEGVADVVAMMRDHVRRAENVMRKSHYDRGPFDASTLQAGSYVRGAAWGIDQIDSGAHVGAAKGGAR